MLDEEVQHVRRYEGRERRAEQYVLYAEVQQREQYADGLLLVPRKHQRQRQLVDRAAEGVRERHGDLYRAVGVVALSHVHYAREAASLAKVDVVEAVLAAGERQHNRVRGRQLHEVGVVVASRLRAVAAADEEEVAYRAALDSLDYASGLREHGAVAETCRRRHAAVDSCKSASLRPAAELERLFDYRREVLVIADVRRAGERHYLRREDAVRV